MEEEERKKERKNPGMSLSEEVKDSTVKTLICLIIEGTRKWKAIRCSWIGRTSFVKMGDITKINLPIQ